MPEPRSVNIAGKLFELDPHTGEYITTGNWDPVPKHRVTVEHADGSTTLVIIKNANDRELRDTEFVLAVVTGDWDRWLIKQQGEPE